MCKCNKMQVLWNKLIGIKLTFSYIILNNYSISAIARMVCLYSSLEVHFYINQKCSWATLNSYHVWLAPPTRNKKRTKWSRRVFVSLAIKSYFSIAPVRLTRVGAEMKGNSYRVVDNPFGIPCVPEFRSSFFFYLLAPCHTRASILTRCRKQTWTRIPM